jgi:hypothetical protein
VCQMIGGSNRDRPVYICNECVGVCLVILSKEVFQKLARLKRLVKS